MLELIKYLVYFLVDIPFIIFFGISSFDYYKQNRPWLLTAALVMFTISMADAARCLINAVLSVM